MKDGRPCKFCLLIIFPVKWHLKNSRQQQSHRNKNKDIFSCSRVACMPLYICALAVKNVDCWMKEPGCFFLYARTHWVIEAKNVLHIQ